MVEIEEAGGSCSGATGDVHGHVHAVGEVLVDGLVAGHAHGVHVLQVEDDPLGLLVGHPFVEPQQRRLESPLEQHLPLPTTLRCQDFRGHVGPAQLFKEGACRLLGLAKLVELVGCGHNTSFNCLVKIRNR